MDQYGLVAIGITVGVHGLSGTLKVELYSAPDTLSQEIGKVLFRLKGGESKRYTIRWVKPHKKKFLASLVGVDNRSQAEFLIGSALYIEKHRLPELEADTYYWTDIIGLKVVTTGQRHLGTVTAIIPTGANDVYVVKKKNREVLVPGLASVVLEIDMEAQTMRVALPEGLSE